jgi:hypothetical protein
MTTEEHNTILRYQRSAPVDITALTTEFGLSVYEKDDLPDGVSGMICRDASADSPGGYSIHVNASDAYTRQRFTIAHELAHYLLHRDKIGDGITDDALYRSDKMTTQDEYAANNKAADLLMPRRLVMKCLSEGTSGAETLAHIFEVSVPAMQVRLRYLLYQ